MTMLEVYFAVLVVVGSMAVAGWLLSLTADNVNAVDALWSLFFLVSGLVAIAYNAQLTGKNLLLFCLLALWAIRLSVFLAYRNWGEAEDRRYRVIREKFNPGFRFKSLFIIYLFQAMLASIIFMGLAPGLIEPVAFRWFDILALSMVLGGILYEAVADWQLQNFKIKNYPARSVMDRGLWGLSRHPNYFGEFLFWWGMFFAIVTPEFGWAMLSPLIMTFLLIKVSGVSLMEKDINSRRPAYAEYMRTTPAFFPRISGLFSTARQVGQVL